ncbi:MAG: hypothetical protein ACJASQ_000015 [Crocinitomicaceae bacterium]|jgi:hypothetical protein
MDDRIKNSLVFVIGLLLLTLYARKLIIYYLRIRKIESNGALFKGVIVDSAVVGNYIGKAPIVEFEIDGKTLRKETVHTSMRLPFKIGHSVEVFYDEENPENCTIKSDPALLIGLGFFILLTSLSTYALVFE